MPSHPCLQYQRMFLSAILPGISLLAMSWGTRFRANPTQSDRIQVKKSGPLCGAGRLQRRLDDFRRRRGKSGLIRLNPTRSNHEKGVGCFGLRGVERGSPSRKRWGQRFRLRRLMAGRHHSLDRGLVSVIGFAGPTIQGATASRRRFRNRGLCGKRTAPGSADVLVGIHGATKSRRGRWRSQGCLPGIAAGTLSTFDTGLCPKRERARYRIRTCDPHHVKVMLYH